VAVIAALYATPTVPPGSDVVEMVSLLGSTGVVEVFWIEPQPARNAAAAKMEQKPKLRMPDLSYIPDPILPRGLVDHFSNTDLRHSSSKASKKMAQNSFSMVYQNRT
jgi:hypothetical protein